MDQLCVWTGVFGDRLHPSRRLPGWEVERGTAEAPPEEPRLELMLCRFLTAAIAPRKVSERKPDALGCCTRPSTVVRRRHGDRRRTAAAQLQHR